MNRLVSNEPVTWLVVLLLKAKPERIEDDRRAELEVVATPRDWVRTADKTLRLNA